MVAVSRVIDNASVKLPTIRGEVKDEFINETSRFYLSVDIPGNTQAKVSLPTNGEVLELKVDNQVFENYKTKDGRVIIENIASGSHQFEIKFEK